MTAHDRFPESFKDLPDFAFIDNSHDQAPGAARVLCVRRGVMGARPVVTNLSAAELNRRAGVSQFHVQVLHYGSIFGWDNNGNGKVPSRVDMFPILGTTTPEDAAMAQAAYLHLMQRVRG